MCLICHSLVRSLVRSLTRSLARGKVATHERASGVDSVMFIPQWAHRAAMVFCPGADVNLRGKGGKTAIHWGIRYAQEDKRILGLLKTFGADLEATNDATDNILHAAS